MEEINHEIGLSAMIRGSHGVGDRGSDKVAPEQEKTEEVA